MIDDFGDSRIFTWTYTNGCNGNQIVAQQEVSLRPVPDIIADPVLIEICLGEYYDLSGIDVTDLNGSNLTLTYHNSTPANGFNQIPSPIISTEIYTTYYIRGTNEFGCSDEVDINFINVDGPEAGTGQYVILCNDGRTVNLWNYLTPPYDNNGYWNDTYGTGLNISNPTQVSFAGKPAGNYLLDYIVPSFNICEDAKATVQFQLVNPGTYQIQDVSCAPNFQTYTVKISVVGYTVTTSAGTVSSAGNIKTIANIPIGSNVTITLKTIAGDCADVVLNITPPQCNCPNIPLPVSAGDKKACQNEIGVALQVSVGNGLSAAWFDAITGGNLLLTKSLIFEPPTTNTAVTTYYVQALDTITGCFSPRIPVLFEVVPNPDGKNAELKECDDNTDGLASFDLTESHGLLITGTGYTFDFYVNLNDALSETNKIAGNNYTNTTNNQILYVVIKNVNGCKDIVELTLKVLPLPTVVLSIEDELCLNGHDGEITVNPPVTGLEFKLNSFPWTTNTQFPNLAPGNYSLQVKDTANCISTYPVAIDPGQQLQLTSFTISCNNNGTGSLASDDHYDIRLEVSSSTNLNSTFRIIYNSQNLGDHAYGAIVNVSIPADGSTGLIEMIDNVTGCKVTKSVGPLLPCSTDCEISINQLNVVCSDNGTDADASDDFYTISFVASVVNGGSSTSFSLLINGVISGTYNYNTTVSFNIPATGTAPDINIRDQLNIQCITNIPVGVLAGCSGACNINGTVSNILCNNAGTINDPSDDTFTFNINVSGFNISNGWQLGTGNTIYPYNSNVQLGPYPISQGNLNLTIKDRIDPLCTDIVFVQAPPVCSVPCVLSINNLLIGACDNNNTGNTTADDHFSISFTINVVSGSTNFYNVYFGAQIFGPFVYGQQVTISGLPANGQNLILNVIDAVNNGCVLPFNASQNPCSSCQQTVNAGADIQLTCAQNTATLTGSASAGGGIFVWTGPGNFNKTGQTVTTSVEGQYILSVTFPDQCVVKDTVLVSKDANLPVANAGPNLELTCSKLSGELVGSSNLMSNVAYTWTNAAGVIISNSQNVTVNATGFYYLEVTNTLNNCKSGKDEVEVFNLNQQLIFNTLTWICDNSGTPSTGDDDTYTIRFNLSNSTGATNKYKVYLNAAEIGEYAYNTNVDLSAPADGNSRTYEFVDVVTGCKKTGIVGPLTSCSTNCLISFEDLVVLCDDNGTESIDTDDVYNISFVVNALNGGISNSFNVLIDGVIFANYPYGSSVTLNFPADRKTPFIQLVDLNINACVLTVPVPALNPCSSTCTISAMISNVLCNDNNTINDPGDDVFTFDVIVEGLNTSAHWKVSGSNTLYDYNVRTKLGPYKIADGQVNLTLVDESSQDCSFKIQVIPPAVCSEPCVLNVADVTILDCNNNNTGNNTNDDFFGVRFKVVRISGSATAYTVSDGQKTYGPYIYGETVEINNLPANGNNILLSVSDNSNTGCLTSFNVSKNPCSSCNQTVDAGPEMTITCTQNVVTLNATASMQGVFTWTGPGNFVKTGSQVQTSVPGVYYLLVTFPDQCTATDSVKVIKDANVPLANAGPDKTLNCLLKLVSLEGVTNQGSGLTLVWSDASGTTIGSSGTINVTEPGTYYFEAIDVVNNCASGKDEVIVTQNISIPEATIIADPGNLLDCIVGTIVLSGKEVANVIFNWQTGESFYTNQRSIVVSSEGLVTMTAIDTINGCENLASIEIIDLQDYPILVTEPAKPITCLTNGTYISAGLSPEGPNLVFNWYEADLKLIPGQHNDSLYVTQPGTYYVILTDTINKCANIDTIQVDRIGDFPQLTLPDDITLYCGISKTAITANVINATSAYNINWYSPDGRIISDVTKSIINVEGEGTYNIDVTYPTSGCKTSENVRVLLDSDFPTAVSSAISNETCKGEKDGIINIRSVTGGKKPIQYKLNGSSVNDSGSYGALAPGNYILEVTDANGCRFDTLLVISAGSEIELLTASP